MRVSLRALKRSELPKEFISFPSVIACQADMTVQIDEPRSRRLMMDK